MLVCLTGLLGEWKMNDPMLMACHECDLLQTIQPLMGKASAKCYRCEAVLYSRKPDSLERTLAFTLAGLILFALAVSFPFLSFKIGAQIQQTTLITGVKVLFEQGLAGLATVVLLTTILAPMLQLLGLLYVLLPLKLGRPAYKLPLVFRWTHTLQPWSMMEVFMLGILVSMVKLMKMAQIIPGISVYAFLALIFVLAAASASLDPHAVWERWENHR